MVLKRVFAIRHGQSVWNKLRLQYPDEEDRYSDKFYCPDCDLTEKGVEQSRHAGVELINKILLLLTTESKVSEVKQLNHVHFVVSPLRRALQTAEHMIQGIRSYEVTTATTNKADITSSETKSTTFAYASWQPKTITVQPLAAEIMMDLCDIGTPVMDLEREFPLYDMELVRRAATLATDAAGCWWTYHRSVDDTWQRMQQRLPEGTESSESIRTRIMALKKFLNDYNPSKEGADGLGVIIVLVCHSEVIWWLGNPSPNWEETADGDINEVDGLWTKNGEIVDLTDFVITQNI